MANILSFGQNIIPPVQNTLMGCAAKILTVLAGKLAFG